MNNSSIGRAGFIDVETTGLKYDDEIIELAISVFKFDWKQEDIMEIEDEYVGLREPENKIHPQAQNVHGILPEQLRGKQLDQERVNQLLDKSELLVAHNASFDRRFVKQLFPRVQQIPWLCSMSNISWKSKGFRSRGLQQLLYDHNISPQQAHRALADVHSAIKLLAADNASDNYNTYFQELLENCSL